MAYDPKKAHEYYLKYRKKGIKKGRKKGRRRATKPKQVSLIGISTGGLNDAGKMQAALIKDRVKKEMNEALQKETDPVKREAIRQEYQNKALEQVSALKADAQYAKPKSTRSSSRKKSSESSENNTSSTEETISAEDRLNSLMTSFSEKYPMMTDEQKEQVRTIFTSILELLKARIK